MMKNSKRYIAYFALILVLGVAFNSYFMYAQESIDDSGVNVYSLGETGETILVKGREATIADYGDVEGYEATSYNGGNYIEYRENKHHSMVVTTSEGSTEGYCMQPYVIGPGTDAYKDYNYVEGLTESSIFKSLTQEEMNRWLTAYVIATKYSFGGYMADPNYTGGVNEHDGGTYGTYIVERDGQWKVVKGLMVGGKVYEMTKDEARALTQVVVHYVGNRGSEYNITDFKGFTHPEETSAAFKHMRAYADGSQTTYDTERDLQRVSLTFDQYNHTKPYQSIEWYVYDCQLDTWIKYNGDNLGNHHIGDDKIVKFKVQYKSKNICNKLINNQTSEYCSVKYNYSPYVVSTISGENNYYDYISVVNSTSVPITVTYNMVETGKEKIKHGLLNNMEYEIDTFSQSAIVEVKSDDLIKSDSGLKLSATTGIGATAANCYEPDTGRYGTRMYSSRDVQDCLFIASNVDVIKNVGINANIDVTGSLSLNKVSARPDITDNNPCYSMEGAVYNVYAVSSKEDDSKANVVGSFCVNEANQGIVSYSRYNTSDIGKSRLSGLPLGYYMICEEQPPVNESYSLNDERYYVLIDMNNYSMDYAVDCKEEPVADPIPFEIVKQCAEGDNVGSATLEGAEFTVSYYKGEYETLDEIISSNAIPDRKWIFATAIASSTHNATCIIHQDLLLDGSDEPYLDNDGEMILPLGTIVVEETKAPRGYKLDGATYNLVDTIDGTKKPIEGPYVSKVEVNQGTVKLSVGNKVIIDEEPIRGDISLRKIDGHTGSPMAGIPFLITSDTTGESHVIVTDEYGIASTSSEHILHSERTNDNDDCDYESVLKPTGIWFSGNQSETQVDDIKGALPYDSYTIQELSCEANKEYYLSKSINVTIDKDNQIFQYGDIENKHKPKIGTEVFDRLDSDKMITKDGNVAVVDKVTYEYLEEGETYILKGIIINKLTGEPLLNDEKPVESTVEFSPSEASGIIDVPFEFQLGCTKGDKLVVYEYLYEKGSDEVIASHEDINCEKQTLTIQITGVKNEIIAPHETMGTEKTPTTGDSVPVKLVAVCLLAVIGIIFILVKVRRKMYER